MVSLIFINSNIIIEQNKIWFSESAPQDIEYNDDRNYFDEGDMNVDDDDRYNF